ncbi:MAG: prepilin-type N-terminal cleavage/methylation domain-containing protein [Phycisphaerales bacterium]|nr:prepilin-type N-terminal cleavage/methylation domain-containing protein [Phycisphaerales bacterium]
MTRRPERSFTLTELIIVMAVIVLLLSISIPAFSALLDSSNRSLAETRLRVAIALGREAALRSDHGDGAVVFFFEPGGRCYAAAYEMVGTIEDLGDNLNTDSPITRDVFVAVRELEPVSLPSGWMVRGLAPPRAAGRPNYESGGTGWYDNDSENGQRDRYADDDRNWVFPETGFYDPTKGNEGFKRQTFMIRFRQGTGALALGETREALILSPAPSTNFRNTWPFSQSDKFNFLSTADPRSAVRDVLERHRVDPLIDKEVVTLLLGDMASDTVLARTVPQLVLYKERELAATFRLQPDRYTGSLYKGPPRQDGFEKWVPQYVGQPGFLVDPEKLNAWLEGDSNQDGKWTADDQALARSFVVQRYGGGLQEVALAPVPGGGADR